MKSEGVSNLFFFSFFFFFFGRDSCLLTGLCACVLVLHFFVRFLSFLVLFLGLSCLLIVLQTTVFRRKVPINAACGLIKETATETTAKIAPRAFALEKAKGQQQVNKFILVVKGKQRKKQPK